MLFTIKAAKCEKLSNEAFSDLAKKKFAFLEFVFEKEKPQINVGFVSVRTLFLTFWTKKIAKKLKLFKLF
jgi:hypothetical protein